MQRIGHRKEKLKEICILVRGGEGGSEAIIQKVLPSSFYVLELHAREVALTCLMSAKTALVCLALQAVPPSVGCGLLGKQPSGLVVW